ncbi:hypothetical protein NF681_11475 [Comamonadaceae bacterium OTU4NAUVB1]|nr:hypothetical protein NF681_11475 [Comamonadaceae bacterium OTU4NAUVB1]
MADTQPLATPRDFCVIDANGKVVMRGQTLDLPQIAGRTTLAERAPENSFRLGNAWVQMPLQTDPAQVFDWLTKTWIYPVTIAVGKTLGSLGIKP